MGEQVVMPGQIFRALGRRSFSLQACVAEFIGMALFGGFRVLRRCPSVLVAVLHAASEQPLAAARRPAYSRRGAAHCACMHALASMGENTGPLAMTDS